MPKEICQLRLIDCITPHSLTNTKQRAIKNEQDSLLIKLCWTFLRKLYGLINPRTIFRLKDWVI